MNTEAIEWLTERVLEALERREPVGPSALRLILRRYCATDRTELAEALGQALAQASEPHALDNECEQPCWLALLVEASPLSDDARLRSAATSLIWTLRRDWGVTQEVEPLAQSIDECLMAAGADVAGLLDPRELVPDAIDELERVIGGAYRPGEGMAERVSGRSVRGRLGDQIRPASALLTAYSCTGRLPYAMLAEELVQFTSRTLWDEEAGGFFGELASRTTEHGPGTIQPGPKPFVLNCEAARVLCRLAALHSSSEYRDTAVIAPGADYAASAARTLAALEPVYRLHGVNGAIYGVALGEWLARSC